MNEENDFIKLRQLSSLYYQRQIDFVSYRMQRKEILDRLERDLNYLPDDVRLENITQPKPKREFLSTVHSKDE